MWAQKNFCCGQGNFLLIDIKGGKITRSTGNWKNDNDEFPKDPHCGSGASREEIIPVPNELGDGTYCYGKVEINGKTYGEEGKWNPYKFWSIWSSSERKMIIYDEEEKNLIELEGDDKILELLTAESY